MDPREELEKLLAKQVRLLQQIHGAELRKKDAIGAGDIKLLSRLENQTADALKEVVSLHERARGLAGEVKARFEPNEKLLQLDQIIRQLAGEAEGLTDRNRLDLLERMNEIFRQVSHVRLGRAALAGYKAGLGINAKTKTNYRGKT